MGAQHTPGLWTIVPYGDGDSLAIHRGQTQMRVCFMATPSSIADDMPRIRADARLIAAAPDLLATLKRLTVQMTNLLLVCDVPDRIGPSFNDGQREAEAVIAKAEGR